MYLMLFSSSDPFILFNDLCRALLIVAIFKVCVCELLIFDDLVYSTVSVRLDRCHGDLYLGSDERSRREHVSKCGIQAFHIRSLKVRVGQFGQVDRPAQRVF